MNLSEGAPCGWKAITVVALLAGGLLAGGTAAAAVSSPKVGESTTRQVSEVDGGADSSRSADLQPRFSTAAVPASERPSDASASDGPVPIGPQYRLSDHVTIGGSLEARDAATLEGAPQAGTYVFGFRATF